MLKVLDVDVLCLTVFAILFTAGPSSCESFCGQPSDNFRVLFQGTPAFEVTLNRSCWCTKYVADVVAASDVRDNTTSLAELSARVTRTEEGLTEAAANNSRLMARVADLEGIVAMQSAQIAQLLSSCCSGSAPTTTATPPTTTDAPVTTRVALTSAAVTAAASMTTRVALTSAAAVSTAAPPTTGAAVATSASATTGANPVILSVGNVTVPGTGGGLNLTSVFFSPQATTVTFTYLSGLWTGLNGGNYADANGRCCAFAGVGNPVPAANWMTLVGRWGNNGTWFALYNSWTGPVDASRRLWLLGNDGDHSDNAGAVVVQVTQSTAISTVPNFVSNATFGVNGAASAGYTLSPGLIGTDAASVEISYVSGQWYGLSGYNCDAIGRVSTPCGTGCLVPAANWMALVGRWGTGAWFVVGNFFTGPIDSSRQLQLAGNDGGFTDNGGSVTMQLVLRR